MRKGLAVRKTMVDDEGSARTNVPRWIWVIIIEERIMIQRGWNINNKAGREMTCHIQRCEIYTKNDNYS